MTQDPRFLVTTLMAVKKGPYYNTLNFFDLLRKRNHIYSGKNQVCIFTLLTNSWWWNNFFIYEVVKSIVRNLHTLFSVPLKMQELMIDSYSNSLPFPDHCNPICCTNYTPAMPSIVWMRNSVNNIHQYFGTKPFA